MLYIYIFFAVIASAIALPLAYIRATNKNNLVPRAFSLGEKTLGTRLMQKFRASSTKWKLHMQIYPKRRFCRCSRLLWIDIVLTLPLQLLAIFFPFLFLQQKQCLKEAKSRMANSRLHIANRMHKSLLIDHSQ